MSGASDAAEKLRQEAEERLRAISAAVSAARTAQADLRGAADLVPVMGAVAGVILALEQMQRAAKDAEAQCRAVLAASMADTGATKIETEGHTVSLRDAPRLARVTDETLLPLHLLAQPPPRPDLAAIGKALREGLPVPGAVLANQREQTIQIRSRA